MLRGDSEPCPIWESNGGVIFRPVIPATSPKQGTRERPECTVDQESIVLLFYWYTPVQFPEEVCDWQRTVCQELGLLGRVRVSKEGINGSLCGPQHATNAYIDSLLAHHIFQAMPHHRFNVSVSSVAAFSDLRVHTAEEVIPLSLPKAVTLPKPATHLSPSEFHGMVSEMLESQTNEAKNTVLIDCRNFYEARIGRFQGAVCPNVRKFQQWPEFVKQNADTLKSKRVLMYCTGGVRCEQGSAVLQALSGCSEVFQLDGGIHKYLEHYPDGYFRGKLYVFDNRVAVRTNPDIISQCFHCTTPHATYTLCTSPNCRILVLACPACVAQGHTFCCRDCAERGDGRENCACVRSRLELFRDQRGQLEEGMSEGAPESAVNELTMLAEFGPSPNALQLTSSSEE